MVWPVGRLAISRSRSRGQGQGSRYGTTGRLNRTNFCTFHNRSRRRAPANIRYFYFHPFLFSLLSSSPPSSVIPLPQMSTWDHEKDPIYSKLVPPPTQDPLMLTWDHKKDPIYSKLVPPNHTTSHPRRPTSTSSSTKASSPRMGRWQQSRQQPVALYKESDLPQYQSLALNPSQHLRDDYLRPSSQGTCEVVSHKTKAGSPTLLTPPSPSSVLPSFLPFLRLYSLPSPHRTCRSGPKLRRHRPLPPNIPASALP